jgi:exodeoxyribonuclease V alpha subunit
LGLESDKIRSVIETLEQSDLIKRETLTYEIAPAATGEKSVREEQAVYLTPFYFSEIGVSKRLSQLIEHPTSRLGRLQPSAFNLKPSGVELTGQQRAAVEMALTHKVTVLTGGPGTGKTTTLRALLDVLDQNRRSYALASPTGRAAKRLAEATGRPAKTIHRLLEFNPGEGFGRNEDNPLDADMIIIDESSMLDLVLAYNLLKAVGLGSHLLLVGDVDQLPSVGAGDVLRDVIAPHQPGADAGDATGRQ